jgi:predicted hydrolase (HD superfamily)
MGECAKLGLTLDEFLELTLDAMRGIDSVLGL